MRIRLDRIFTVQALASRMVSSSGVAGSETATNSGFLRCLALEHARARHTLLPIARKSVENSENPGIMRQARFRGFLHNEPPAGFEPATCSLRGSCSTPELRRPVPANRHHVTLSEELSERQNGDDIIKPNQHRVSASGTLPSIRYSSTALVMHSLERPYAVWPWPS